MTKNIVVKDNALINASYNLELVEQRLILLAIVEARRTNQEIKPNEFLTINATHYIEQFGVHRNVAYKSLKEACSNLFERRFSYEKLTAKGNIEKVTSRWVQSIAYVENEAIVRLKFSDDVTPLITMLEQHFTSYELEQVAELTSKYAVRLYEILIAWKKIGKTPMIKIDELRKRLGIPDDEYQVVADFKKRVLDNSIKQISEKADISVSYEQQKEGRRIVGFTFKVNIKNQEESELQERDTKTVDMFTGLTDDEQAVINARIDDYIASLKRNGQTVTDFHRQNITKKAVSEQWGIEEYKTKKEQDKRILEQLESEKEREEQARQDAENILNEVITKFESLTESEQDFILDKIENKLMRVFKTKFKQARQSNSAHKNSMFTQHFYELLCS